MSSGETLPESGAERDRGVAGRVESLARPLVPEIARQAESGNLAAASGAVSLVRAGRTFLKGNRKRGALLALGGLFWVGVALAQRRFSGARSPRKPHAGDDLSEVAGTSPDVEEAVEPGDRETDHATGEEVVDTSNPDVESESGETTLDADESPEVTGDVETDDVDQRDVVGSSDVANSDEGDTDEGDESSTTDGEGGRDSDLGESEEAAFGESEESETAE